ncbi:endo-beta-N-acetylglucosaminidase [Spiroplasma turonicum]|uniref:Endo-beta-N-acetylglucosaminidase n=1 Tax=Spiroplasma turonicum TaxID=216946 RepID=A0A0K1P7R6_9MOLU|nr:hypothetical protein [Spiroplasma turonicum]AKU79927.1 endo-beta-N-acetylglucosaminidase [Spiroplasma turonicum]ALX70941.1 endo-beta-N-acetylglucosaminidase [Spiroplasma turonicum]
MKKLLSVLLLTSLPIVFVTQSISCSLDFSKDSNYIKDLENFNWKDPNLGDGTNFDPYDDVNKVDEINTDVKNLGEVTYDNVGNYIDYNNFNTGFQWKQNIDKQAVTGVPLNKGFMPNGNYAKDFGTNSPAQSFRRLNSILDWDPNVDNDSKYNKSEKKLLKSEFTSAKNVSTQDQKLKYNYLGFSTRKHRTFDNTIVGTKNPFENTNLNWQYNNIFINWSGSWFEGPIIPPPADVIELAHLNGSKIFGNIFLDGYHGLTKEMIKDFVKKDSNGNYLIVDKLIEIANYIGFNGWFINNESNGVSPNGTVLDYEVMAKIISDFNAKTALSKNEDIKNLNLIYYRNDSTVSYNGNKYYDNETVRMASTGYKDENVNKLTELQVNFGELPERALHFLEQNPDYNPENLYTMIDGGYNGYISGSYDYRNLAYKKSADSANNGAVYDKSIYSSFSTYLDEGSGSFALPALKLTTRDLSDNRKFIFEAQVGHLFNDIQYSGTNLFLSEDDNGVNASKLKKYTNGIDYRSEFIKADPRIHFDEEYEVNKNILENIYDFSTNKKNINTNSYGIGNLIQEKTVFNDENIKDNNLKTNFSTGSGIKFVNANVFNEYPWTNRRLADILPTYKWRFFNVKNPKTALPINQFSGGYDYDEVYKKGNSIVIGNGFNEAGEILNSSSWDLNETYGWDIIGTNIKDNKKKINIVYKDNSKDNNTLVSFRLSFADNLGNLNNETIKSIQPDEVEKLDNGWRRITLNLDNINISENNPLAMVGLNIKPNSEDFKLNVGELSISDISYKDKKLEVIISKVKSEYIIYRDFENTYKYSLRFNWNSDNLDSLSYFDILIYTNENEYYKIGETNQLQYYLKDLELIDGKLNIAIKPIYKNDKEGKIYKFFINLV